MPPLHSQHRLSAPRSRRRWRQGPGLTVACVVLCTAGQFGTGRADASLPAASAASAGSAGSAASAAPVAVPAAAAAVTANPIGVDSDGSSSTQKGSALYASNPGLSPQAITNGSFGQLFATQLHGDIQTQPLVAGGTLLVATESNYAYGLDPVTGAVRWTDYLGIPWNPAVISCDAAPTEGVTGTPVVVGNVEYFTSKSYASGGSGPASYYFDALNVTTGAEQPGFPRAIFGTASNDPALVFTADDQLQRPGLVYTGGVVYAAFGASCDHEPSNGWVVGVNPAGTITAMWSTEAGSYADSGLGGVWAPGALRSDGPGSLVFATGNGYEPPTLVADTPGVPIPGKLGEAVVRLQAQPTGELVGTDFFIPFDAVHLNVNDGDLGSGAPVILPSQFSTPTHPKLIVEIGKEGYLYVLDASRFGGWGQGANGGDKVLARLGPVQGVWGDPAIWTGDGGYVYFVANGGAGAGIPGPTQGHLLAWKFGVDGAGNPTFAQVGQSADAFAYGSSSPVVTSNGTTSGSSVLWVNWAPAEYSPNSQLRAYNPIPDQNGNLAVLWSAPSGAAAKLSTPGVANNRVYVGGFDGVLHGYGSPVKSPLSGGGLQFPDTTVGTSSTINDTLSATEPVTITGITLSGPGFSAGPLSFSLPISLDPANPNLRSITGPIHFAPVNYGANGGTITITTSKGTYAVGLEGNGLSASALLTVTPKFLSFEGTSVNTSVTHDVIFNNQGSKPLKVTSIGAPASPFVVTGLPAVGTTIAAGGSVGVVVTYAPTAVGQNSSTLTLNSDTGGSASLSLSGTAGVPAMMTVSPTLLAYPSVAVGATETESFTVSNTGGSVLTINKSHVPSAGTFVATSVLNEGSQLQPGQSVTETVKFAPTTAGTFVDQWTLNGSGNSNLTYVTFTGTAT